MSLIAEALLTVGRKDMGSNPIRVMWDIWGPDRLLPRDGNSIGPMGGWDHTAVRHPLHGRVFEGVALQPQPPKGGRGCLMSPPCLESQSCHLIPL